MKERICVVCEKKFKGYGNNAMPLEKGLCCDKCNKEVIIARLLQQALE